MTLLPLRRPAVTVGSPNFDSACSTTGKSGSQTALFFAVPSAEESRVVTFGAEP